MYTDKTNVLQLLSLMRAHGVRRVVVAPGSRNIPLAQGFTACPDFECFRVTDERSAGFFALGLALEGGEPAAVCCTSGSALLNIHPAVAEAYYQQVPLLVISADRPAAWIGQMDGQTLPQPGVFGQLVRRAVALPEVRTDEDAWHSNRLINEALLALRGPAPGPVHVNIPIGEPFFAFPTEALPPERVIRYHSQKKKMDNGMVYPGIYPAEIFDVFERERFDYIHVHHPMFVGPWALWLGRKYGIPVIYTYHTRYEDYLHYIPCFRIREESTVVKRKAVEWIQKKVIPAYMRWFCNRCDLVLAPSEGMQQMIKGYGVNTPIAVFPTGLDESFFRKNARRAQEIRETCSRGKRHLLATVSRLEKEKNYGFLLRGITELERKMGDDFHVLIIGDGSQKAELKVRASILGIRDKVTFAGNIPNDQVKDYLNAADLFLFASKSETQGIVLAEALAAGTPVVAVHAVGSDDIIRNGENGFLTAEREDEWAEKVIETLQEENLERMKSAAFISAGNYRSSRLAIYEEMLYNQCGFRKGDRLYETEEGRRERSAMALR